MKATTKVLEVWCNAWDMFQLAEWQARDQAPEGAKSFTITGWQMVDEEGLPSVRFHGRLSVTVVYFEAEKGRKAGGGFLSVRPPLVKKLFGIDAVAGIDPVIEGWTDGRTWNGWDTPCFEREPFIKWLTESKIVFELRDDGVIVITLEGCDPEPIKPDWLTLPDGREVWMYEPSGWCWNEAEVQASAQWTQEESVCGLVDEIAEERGVEYATDENIAVLVAFIEKHSDPATFRKFVEGYIEPGPDVEDED